MAFMGKNPAVVAELLFFLFKFGDSMLEPTVRLYIYQGVCLKEYHNFSGCEDMKLHPDWEENIQTKSAGYLLAYRILNYVPAVVISLFAGAWSDHVGRKIPVVLPCFGTIIAVLLYMFSMLCSTQAMLPLVLTGSAIRGIFGKSAVITMALHSYVSDVTSKEERTQKLGQLLAMNYFGYFAGSLLAGALLGYTTYDVIFCIVVVIMAVAVIVGLVLLKESLPQAAIIDSDATLKEKVSALRKSPFHIDHLKEVLEVLRKPRVGHGSRHLAFLFSVIIFNQLCKSGEQDITLLFVKRSPLSWSKSLYGYLVAVDYACLGVGAMLILPALVRFFGMTDMALVVTGSMFKTLRVFMLAFADVTWMVFLGVFLGAPSGMIISSCKSMISKIVSDDELGKVFSLLSCSEMMSNLFGSLIFTSLYSGSIHMYRGFVFTLDGGAHCIMLLLLIVMAWKIHRDKRLNLLYNTLEYSDYGTTTPESQQDPATATVDKRLSHISEDEIERMSIKSSRWRKKSSSSSEEPSPHQETKQLPNGLANGK